MAKKTTSKKRAKKVLPPSKVTDAKLFSKSLFIRKTHHEEAEGVSGKTSIDEMLTKTNHYSAKVQQQAMCRIEQFIKDTPDLISNSVWRRVTQRVASKLLSEHVEVRNAAQRIHLQALRSNAFTDDVTIFPVIRAAVTHMDASVRFGTLSFLKLYLSLYETGRRRRSQPGIVAKKLHENAVQKEVLSLFICLIKIFDETSLSSGKGRNTSALITGVTSLFGILHHDRTFENLSRDQCVKMSDFISCFANSLVVPSTVSLMCGCASDEISEHVKGERAIPTMPVDPLTQKEAEQKTSQLVQCFAHVLLSIFALRKTGNTPATKGIEVDALVNSILRALAMIFQSFRDKLLRVHAAILFQLSKENLNAPLSSANADFVNSVVIPWAIGILCREKSLDLAKKVTLFLWKEMIGESDQRDYTKSFKERFPNSTVLTSRYIQLSDFFREIVRSAASSGNLTLLSIGVLERYRERVESVILRNVDDRRVQSGQAAKDSFHDGELDMYADLPYVLWKLRRRWMGHTAMNDNITRHIVQHIAIILWHLMRTYGGVAASGNASVNGACGRMIQTISKGCLLLFRQSKIPNDAFGGDQEIQAAFYRILRYCDPSLDVSSTLGACEDSASKSAWGRKLLISLEE